MSDTTTRTMKDDVARLVDLHVEKAKRERQLRQVKEQIAELEPQLLEQFAEHGVRKIGDIASGKTVYIRRDVRVKNMGDDREAACAALRAAGLGEFVAESFNLNTLSAHFRELLASQIEQGDVVTDPNAVLPPPLRGVIELTDVPQLRVTS